MNYGNGPEVGAVKKAVPSLVLMNPLLHTAKLV